MNKFNSLEDFGNFLKNNSSNESPKTINPELVKNEKISNKKEINLLEDPFKERMSLGIIDSSVQENYDLEFYNSWREENYYRLKTSEDLAFLDVYIDSSQHSLIESLKEGKFEYYTDKDLSNKSINYLEDKVKKLEDTLPNFKSDINRELQKKRIDYIKTVLDFLKIREELISDYEKVKAIFSTASNEKPICCSDKYLKRLLVRFLDNKRVNVIEYDKSKKVGTFKKVDEEKIKSALDLSNVYFDTMFFIENNEISKDNHYMFYHSCVDPFFLEETMNILEDIGYEYDPAQFKFFIKNYEEKEKIHIIKMTTGLDVFYCGQCDVVKKKEAGEEDLEKIKSIALDIALHSKNTNAKFEEAQKIFLGGSQDGIHSIVKAGKLGELPLRFKVIYQNRDTYTNIIVDQSKIKKGMVLKLKLEDSDKPHFIGKGGKNIKSISESLGIRIQLL